ncbi:precorrin-8X methylmutase [Kutzneria viridogrisea]|uniref:Precorrin-8X/cobalt-precorrin-8 methylmutase n=1 Tax=Kutzneria viridogrisea TaxID=47990 RepID=A0ABR6BMA2_9PSEU|nr:precorrin-8X/cobalt-precorrin-8 methylmutase [Kutzneria viridogrisea]
MARVRHPIEQESYRILRSRVDTSGLPVLSRAVVERLVHTTADPSWAGDLLVDERALESGRRALTSGVPLITDVRMVAAGVTSRPAHIAAETEGGIGALAGQYPQGAVFALGQDFAAVAELAGLCASGALRPALVIALPAGFVGAVEAKRALRESGVPALTNRGERGGAALATAAVNALLYA